MPFDFQQRKSFRFYVILVLEDATVGDAVLHYFTGILPCAQEVDAGAGMGNGEHVLMIILFHDFGASTDHPFHYLVAGFTAVLHKKGALVFGIEVFALAFKSAMNVEVTDDSLTFTTYKTADQSVVDAYSIVKVDSGE